MTRIIIEAVSPQDMRLDAYKEDGFGDWFFDKEGDLHIQVAGTHLMERDEVFLIALHELVEAKLCFNSGVTQNAVDHFDASFAGEAEPGDDPRSPYQKQHRAACLLEHQMAIFLGRWDYGEVR